MIITLTFCELRFGARRPEKRRKSRQPRHARHSCVEPVPLVYFTAATALCHFTLNTSIGSDLPFTVSGFRRRSWNLALVRSAAVDCEMMMLPGGAFDIRREALLTVSPITV